MKNNFKRKEKPEVFYSLRHNLPSNHAFGIVQSMEHGKVYGYIRVSTKEQNEDRQRIALLEMGVPEKNIYMDKQSGKDFSRPQYQKLLKKLDNGA